MAAFPFIWHYLSHLCREPWNSASFSVFRILASVSVQIVDRQREINHFYIKWYRVNCTIILYALQGIQRELLNTPQISSNVLPLCKDMQRRFTWATLLHIKNRIAQHHACNSITRGMFPQAAGRHKTHRLFQTMNIQQHPRADGPTIVTSSTRWSVFFWVFFCAMVWLSKMETWFEKALPLILPNHWFQTWEP